MGLLSDIQAGLLEGQGLAPILLKLRFLASRLGSEALEEWVRYESEGYPPDAEVPPYRRFNVSYTASFHGAYGKQITNAQIPPLVVAQTAGEDWLQHDERQGIGAIEELLNATEKSKSNLAIDASNLIVLFGNRVYTGMYCNSVQASVSRGFIVSAIDNLRARILELTIQLEKSAPEIAAISVSSPNDGSAKEFATVVNYITNNTVHGNQNSTNISNNGDGATFNISVAQGDVGALQKALGEAGLDESEAKEFSELVASEKPESDREPFGKKAKAWLAKNLVAVSGKVGIAVAAKLIAGAVAAFYGLP